MSFSPQTTGRSRQTNADALERLRSQKEVREQKEQQRQEQKKKPVVKSGWMVKKGAKRRNWKRRYFQLRVDQKDLRYFPSPNTNAKPLGTINLTQALRVRPEKLFKIPGAPAFSILLPNRCFILIAEDEVERDLWLKKIKLTGVAITTELPKYYFGSKDWEETSKMELMELLGKSTISSSVFSSDSQERPRTASFTLPKLFGLTKKVSLLNVKTADQSLSSPPPTPERKSVNANELRPLCANGQPMAVKELPEVKAAPRTSNEVIMTAHEVIAFKAKSENTPPSSPKPTPATVHSPPVEKQLVPSPPKKTKTVIRKSIRPVSRINPVTEAVEYEEVEVEYEEEVEFEEEVEEEEEEEEEEEVVVVPVSKHSGKDRTLSDDEYEWEEDYEEIEEIIEWVEEEEEYVDISKRMSKLHTVVSKKIDEYKSKVEDAPPDIASKKVTAYENHMKRMTVVLENKMKRQTTNFQNMDHLLKLLNEQKD